MQMPASGREALAIVGVDAPSLVVLDLMLPDLDGIEVCRRIRETSTLPVLMLTARDDDLDKIAGLEVGADDYLTKPFNPRELVARVEAILRRSDGPTTHPTAVCSGTATSSSTRAGASATSGRRRSGSRPRSSTSSGSSSTTRASSSRATSCSSGSGATRSRATPAPSTSTYASCGGSSATRRRSSPCGGSATRPRPARRRRRVGARVQITALPAAGAVPARHRARRRRRDADRGQLLPELHPHACGVASCGAESAGIVELYAQQAAIGHVSVKNLELALSRDKVFWVPAVPATPRCSPARCPSSRAASCLPPRSATASRLDSTSRARHGLSRRCAGSRSSAGVPAGSLVVAEPESALRSRWLQLVWRLALAFGIGIPVAGVVVLYFSRRIARRRSMHSRRRPTRSRRATTTSRCRERTGAARSSGSLLGSAR